MSKLGDYVKTRRQELNLSQIKLAKVSGVSKATISQIESGFQAHPRSDTLQGIAKALRIPYEALDRLARGLPYAPNQDEAKGRSLEDWTHGICSQVQGLPIPQRERDNLTTIIEKFLDRYRL